MRRDNLTPFSIYIEKDLRHRIREAAAKHDMEMSKWTVNAIESYLRFVEVSLPRSNPRKKIKEEKAPTVPRTESPS